MVAVTDVTNRSVPDQAYGLTVTTSEQPITDDNYLPPMLNPFEPGFFDDPYSQYQAVREQDPVHLSPIGAWALFRYEDVHRVLRDPHLSVEERHANLPPPVYPPELQALAATRASSAATTRCSTSTHPITTVCGDSSRRCSRRG